MHNCFFFFKNFKKKWNNECFLINESSGICLPLQFTLWITTYYNGASRSVGTVSNNMYLRPSNLSRWVKPKFRNFNGVTIGYNSFTVWLIYQRWSTAYLYNNIICALEYNIVVDINIYISCELLVRPKL